MDIYNILDKIEKNPGMILGEYSFKALYFFVLGYGEGYSLAGGALESGEPPFQEFGKWLNIKLDLPPNVKNWYQIIRDEYQDDAAAMRQFFVLLTEFRSSKVA